jgi:hypothetical protein
MLQNLEDGATPLFVQQTVARWALHAMAPRFAKDSGTFFISDRLWLSQARRWGAREVNEL